MSDNTEPLVAGQVERGIATITLNRPRSRNALSARLRTELLAQLDAALRDDDVRAIALTGSGPVFCAGADLKEVAAERAGSPPDPDAPGMPELFEALLSAPKPVVAKLNGPARAGGIGLAAAADIAIAPESADFAFTEVRIGVVPAIISVPVAARMHSRQLSRYFLTGETFGAAAAEAAGLLTAAVADAELDTAVDQVLAGLRQSAPSALIRTKELLNARGRGDRDAEFTAMGELSRASFASDDAAEGRAAFFEKRPARWVV